MRMPSKGLLVVALLGSLSFMAPALAAPPPHTPPPHMPGPSGPGPGPGLDCSLPINAHNPMCMGGPHGPGGGPPPHDHGPGPVYGHGPGPGFGFGPGYGPRFGYHPFRGFNFGFFAVPTFSIDIGVPVPYGYALRPVPRSIYRIYPQYRGYLFFVDRMGDVVIVSPRSHRIVAIL